MRPSVLVLASFVAAPLTAQVPTPIPAQPPQIVTTGEGDVQIMPDRARIFLTVETRATTAAAAADSNARRQRSVLDRLRALGIPDRQVGTSGYSVQPEYEYPRDGGRPRIIGYIARNTVRVELDEIGRVGPIVDAALAAGANTIGGLQFYSMRADDARRQALAQAVAQARADAQAMAGAAGGTLGPLIEITTSSMTPPPMPMPQFDMMRAQAAETPIQPGEQTLRVFVTARWQFVAR